MEQILFFNTIQETIKGNASIVVEQWCNGYEVINTGTTTCFVNGRPLYAGTPGTNNGDSITFGGNRGEVFYGRIDISFNTGAGECLVTQKIYLPNIKTGTTI